MNFSTVPPWRSTGSRTTSKTAIRCALGRSLPSCSEGRVLLKDRVLQCTQLLAGLEPELVRQDAPCFLKRGERVGLAARAVERPHQLPAESLSERMLLDELLELTNEIAVTAELEICIDALLQRRQAPLLEPADLVPRKRLESEILQCGSSPE